MRRMGKQEATASQRQYVQLGNWDVTTSLLEEPGVSWQDAIADWFPNGSLPPRRREHFPLKGWRVLDTSRSDWAEEVSILGAPSTEEPGRWVLVQLSRHAAGNHITSPAVFRPLPVQEVRRQGLRLGWSGPEFSMACGGSPDITVVLVNESDIHREPVEEDDSHVQGLVLDLHGQRIGDGSFVHGMAPPIPELGPGQRIELPAFRNNPELTGLPAGEYQLAAILTSLNLRAEGSARLTIR